MGKIKIIYWSLKAYLYTFFKLLDYYKNNLLFFIKNLVKFNSLIGVYDLSRENLTFNIYEFGTFLTLLRSNNKNKKIIIYVVDYKNTLKKNSYRKNDNYLSNNFRYYNLCIPSLKNIDNLKIILENNKIFTNFIKIFNIHCYEPLAHQAKINQLMQKNHLQDVGRSEKSEIEIVSKWLYSKKIKKSKLVTLTLRNSSVDSHKNSNFENWANFYDYIEEKGFFPVLIPDTDTYCFNLKQQNIFELGTFNINLRNAIYEISVNNYFVESGPFLFATFNSYNYSKFSTDPKQNPVYLNQTNMGNKNKKFEYKKLYLIDDSFENLKNDFDLFQKEYKNYFESN